ncbi:stage V sporulation protein B [Desulfofundulus sp. TPOSR]|jgi:stage V sporulation protein B|uniref:Stage V sporulation protein B n=1 Tax=Desulfofundulus kuznetsovii (strain DSM 6115 / VKM B-1805 / 17) TaxID=760568 RepID=A0AAU8P9D4_DESK7|nr:stage V sporulation protein B [Desulfofundulus sp. TPOSR]AEG14999.1 stage V sporulation protein B [Desulfofundulus kuznetsovii DSM 6115]NHM25554.1 stage V sporulation protein B [Desulfofundulus sp. TPOSR]
MSRQSFVYGAFILLLASLCNRLIGFVYQILMIRLIRPEGVGLFNMVYPIYVLVLVLATAGIPVAIAKLMAEEVARGNLGGAYRVFSIAFWWIVASSLFFTLVLILGAPLLQQYVFPNPKVYYCFLSLVPGIIIVSLCSAFRGFFQGLQQMTPTAVTQVVEQLVRVIAGLGIAWFMLPRGIEYAAMGISLGVVLGEFVGFLSMLAIYFKKRPSLSPFAVYCSAPALKVTGRIFDLAVPVTLTRFVSTAFLSVDAMLIPRRLQVAGMTLNEATGVYGQFVGIAESLLFTPSIVTISLATALVPAISDALAQNDLSLVRGRTEEALRLTMLAGLPATAVFFLLPKELCQAIFGYADAGVALGTLALGGPFLYLQQTTTGILQGLGRAERPLRNLIIAAAFKVAGIYYLTAVPALGIRGTALSLCAAYMIMSLLNYRDLKKIIALKVDFGYCLGKPLVATVGMAVVMWYARNFMLGSDDLSRMGLLIVLFLGGATYLLLLFLSGGVHSHDLRRLASFLGWRR